MGASQASGGIGALESALRKIGSNGGLTVTQDDLIIALSKVDAQLNLEDIKDFFRMVRGERR